MRVKKKVILTTLQKKSRYMTGSDDLMQRALGIIMAQQLLAKKGIFVVVFIHQFPAFKIVDQD